MQISRASSNIHYHKYFICLLWPTTTATIESRAVAFVHLLFTRVRYPSLLFCQTPHAAAASSVTYNSATVGRGSGKQAEEGAGQGF